MSKHALTWAWGVNKNYYFFFQALEEERSQINDLIFYLKELEKEEQTKYKISRKKKITKIRTEIESKNTIERVSETKSWLYEKLYKIDKLLVTFTKKEKKQDSNKLNYKWNRRHYNWYHRNTKDHKRLLWTIIGKKNWAT